MNNEENKSYENDHEPVYNTEENVEVVEEKEGNGTSDSPSKNLKIAIIAIAACVLIAAIVFMVIMLGGNGNNGDDNVTDDGKGDVVDDENDGNEGGEGNEDNKPPVNNVSYDVVVKTQGGMPLVELPVYVYDYADGEIGYEIIAYAATDKDGKVTFNLPEDGSYAIRVDNGLSEGYEALSFYPLVSDSLDVKVETELLPESDLSGIRYTLGSVMNDFSVTTTTGDVFTLSEVLKEKDAVLINFWYTTCQYCVAEFPLMQKAYEKYKDELAIIALDPPMINSDTIFDIRQFQNNYGLTFDVALDEDSLYAAFGVEGYPTSVIIDRYGVITFIESGAITSERDFDQIFKHFTADDYNQILVTKREDIVPKEKPDVQMPSSEEISNVFDKGNIDNIQYIPYRENADADEKEFSWPFVIDTVKFEGSDTEYNVIKTSNAYKEGSFAQILFNVDLKAGEALAFDYYSSTELSADILYVIVDGKDIYSISGQSEDWQTCYAYVAEEDGNYEVAFVYIKDSSDNGNLDTVFLKDLRIVSEEEVDKPTYIFRFAATEPDSFGTYTQYVEIYKGTDGYYHVGSVDGPILLAELMGYSRFSEGKTAYELAGELYAAGNLSAIEYDRFVDYCSYASNSEIYGAASVTEELKEFLQKIAHFYGESNETDWLRFCCYYDAYATNGNQLSDPIKGLAAFSAYDVILSERGDGQYPNSFYYNRMIMPRGLLAKFTPTVSGTYLISSQSVGTDNEGNGFETDAWIFTAEGIAAGTTWYTYENNDKLNLDGVNDDANNCYMMLYLEAGKDYYIDIAFYDVYQIGTINFRVEYLGGEGYYKFALASPGYFTTLEDTEGEMKNWLISGGISVELGEDGIWREKRNDGIVGSILYADFTTRTPMFSHSIQQMIELGSFDFSKSEEDQYVLNYLRMNDNDPAKCDAVLRELWGDTYDEYAEIYQLSDVYAGIYHGKGEDYTELARSYLSMIITEGYNAQLDETIAANDPRIGCVVVTEDLAELLQILMDKYTLVNGSLDNPISITNSWAKLCYYMHYYCAATPK